MCCSLPVTTPAHRPPRTHLSPSMAAMYEDLSSSRSLGVSVSSLSSSRQQSQQIAKAYRQAAQLYLTRRLPEALSTVEPVIAPPPPDQDANGASDADFAGHAPIATASRGTRVKVWSFYLTFLNSVIELGAEEGKLQFGSARWKQLVSKCRDGSVWDQVVRDGYAGVEGDVDAEVVVNLCVYLCKRTSFPANMSQGHFAAHTLALAAAESTKAGNLPLCLGKSHIRHILAHVLALLPAKTSQPAEQWHRHASGSQHTPEDPRALHSPRAPA